MRYALAAVMAGAALAAPRPQGLDFDIIEAAAPVPTASIPVIDAEAATSVVDYIPTAAATSAAADIEANPVKPISRRVKRDNSACAQQPDSSDTAEAFLANEKYSTAANAAGVPSGYSLSYRNLKASSNAFGYMGYSTLKTYDVDTCASRCNGIVGCSAFNLYFERDPSEHHCNNPTLS